MTNMATTPICEKIKILKSFFKSRENIQRREHGPYFEVSAIQASSVTLKISDDEKQRNVTVL